MNTTKLLGFCALFISNLVMASPACTGFKLKLKNINDLSIKEVKFYGAELSPVVNKETKNHSEHLFTVNNTTNDLPMYGEFVLKTISLPKKTVTIGYTLENKGLICEHNLMETYSDIPVNKTRTINQVAFTITSYKAASN
jgi:hypothetical protein